jgi:hypothetical protein
MKDWTTYAIGGFLISMTFVATAHADPPTKKQLKHKIVKLERKVHRLRVVRTDLQNRISALEGQPAATPAPPPTPTPTPRNPVANAVEQIRQEVAFAEATLSGRGYSRNALIAHAAMDYVEGHVSAPAYGYMSTILNVRPDPTAHSVLTHEAGICGHAALTLAAILSNFGLPVRSVQFYYGPNGHIANEVFYDGAWHYYDPTWGSYYRDGNRVLSITEARTHPNPLSLLKYHGSQFWYTVAEMAGATSLTDFGMETDPDTRVEIDKQPF